jgi:hypothetical protein
MAYYDTLQYVDGSGATQEVALQNVNLAGSPAVSLKLNLTSHAASTFTIAWAQPPETGIAVPFKSQCVVFANRSSSTGNANSFSGGTILFQGRRWDNPGSASATRVATSIVLKDALEDLKFITLQAVWQEISGGTIGSPTYSTVMYPDVVLFQATPGVTYSPAPVNGTITTWQVMQYIINFAATYYGVNLQLNSSAEFTPVYNNWYGLRCGKCDEALKIALRAHPACYTEVDYTTTPPTLHIRNRANMTAVTLPYAETDGNGVMHIASDLQPLPHLVPDAVRIYYKINGTYNGQPTVGFSNDIYPSGAANSLLCLDYSVDVTGAATTATVKNFSSVTFDPTQLSLWRQKVPSLLQQSQGGQVPNDGSTGALAIVDTNAFNSSTHPKGIQVLGDDGTDYSASYGSVIPYLTDDTIYSWYQLASGSITVKKVTVKAFFSYQKITGAGDTANTQLTDQFKEHVHTFRCVLCSIPSGEYVLKQLLNGGESIPSGLAQAIYTELSDLQYKLRHEIIQVAGSTTTVPTLIKPGKHKLNLANGAAAWTSINAVPETVTVDFFRAYVNKNDGSGSEWRLVARQQIACGPVNHLEPGYLVQLANLFWNRHKSGIDLNQPLNGTLSSTQVDLSVAAEAKENSVPAVPVPVVNNLVYVDGSGNLTVVKNSAQDVAKGLAL